MIATPDLELDCRGMRCPRPIIELAPTWDEYSKKLGKNLRANVGRRRRQLEKAFKTELGTVDDPAELHQAMEELYALHNRRWRKRGASGDAAHERAAVAI